MRNNLIEPCTTFFAIGLIVGLANTVGCRSTTPAPWPYVGVYSGYYSRGRELSFFQPQGSSERWWLSNYEKIEATQAAQNSEIYLVVQGSITPKGRYGHLGAYDRELRVSQ